MKPEAHGDVRTKKIYLSHGARAIGRMDPVIAKSNCNSQSASEYLEKYATRGRIGIKIKNPGH